MILLNQRDFFSFAVCLIIIVATNKNKTEIYEMKVKEEKWIVAGGRTHANEIKIGKIFFRASTNIIKLLREKHRAYEKVTDEKKFKLWPKLER